MKNRTEKVKVLTEYVKGGPDFDGEPMYICLKDMNDKTQVPKNAKVYIGFDTEKV
jgi:hypothetical protein